MLVLCGVLPPRRARTLRRVQPQGLPPAARPARQGPRLCRLRLLHARLSGVRALLATHRQRGLALEHPAAAPRAPPAAAPRGRPARQSLSGNAACAEGALAAGCSFFACYPITPSTDIA